MTDRTDNFNRADSSTSLGTPSDGGSAWVAQQGTWGISSNAGYNIFGGDHDTATLESSVSDCDVQVTLSVTPAGDAGICARLADSTNFLQWIYANGSGVYIYKCVSGSFTVLGAVGYSASAGDVLKFSLSGSSLNGYVNGTLKVGPLTDSTFLTNTKHGIEEFRSSAARWDTFSITGTGGGGSTRPVKMAGRFGGYAGASGGFAG